MYWRARLEVFREAIAQAQNDDPDIALLRNGVMRNKATEEMLSEARMKEKEFPNSPLSLVEVCSFNTWFAKHPEKVCGEEILKQFKRVTEANAPNLYELLHSREGYAKAEEMVIRKVIHDQMIPAAVIPLIEQELEMI